MANGQQVLRIVNPLLLLLALVQASSGFLHGQIPYGVFSTVHGLTGLLLTLAILVHIFYNRQWFFMLLKRKKSTTTK